MSNASSVLADLYDDMTHDREQARVLLEIAETLDRLARARADGGRPGATIEVQVPHLGAWDLTISIKQMPIS